MECAGGRKRPRLSRLSAGVAQERRWPAGQPAEGAGPGEDKPVSRGTGEAGLSGTSKLRHWEGKLQKNRRQEGSVLDALAGLPGLWANRSACRCDHRVLEGTAEQLHPQQSARGGAHFRALSKMLKNSLLPRLLKKVQMQGGAHSEARGVLGPYVAAPRERANAPPAAVPSAAGRAVRPFSAAC